MPRPDGDLRRPQARARPAGGGDGPARLFRHAARDAKGLGRPGAPQEIDAAVGGAGHAETSGAWGAPRGGGGSDCTASTITRPLTRDARKDVSRRTRGANPSLTAP